jgi:hypothetical protein
MKKILRNFLADESRALRVLVDASVAAMAFGLVVAISAVILMS